MSNNSSDNSKVKISSIADFQKKVKFSNKEVSSLVNRFVSTLGNVEYFTNVSIVDSLRFILSASLEVAIQYHPMPEVDLARLSPGDVVECKFGTHVDGEVSGMAVHSIICDIQTDEETVYLLPITKQILDGDARKYMLMRAPHDVSYFDPKFTGGTILLRMGKYVRYERIRTILGKVSPEFFETVLCRFHESMDFSGNVPENVQSFSSCSDLSHTTMEEALPPPEDSGSSETEAVPKRAPSKPKEKKIPFEAYMENFMGPILESINDPDFGIEDKVALLLSELKFEDKSAIIHDAFVVSCEVPRVTITSILAALSKIHRRSDKELLKEALYSTYAQWLSQEHPEILEKYPSSSIMTMFKIFSKKMK